MLSNGFLPGCEEANEMCPGVCQSCVSTTFRNALAMRLMTGMTSSPLATARLPPGRKQFCTSTTTSAVSGPGLILPCASAAGMSEANDNPPATAMNDRRETSCMVRSLQQRHRCYAQLMPLSGLPEVSISSPSPAVRRTPTKLVTAFSSHSLRGGFATTAAEHDAPGYTSRATCATAAWLPSAATPMGEPPTAHSVGA